MKPEDLIQKVARFYSYFLLAIGLIGMGFFRYLPEVIKNPLSNFRGELYEIWEKLPAFLVGFLFLDAIALLYLAVFFARKNGNLESIRGLYRLSMIMLIAGAYFTFLNWNICMPEFCH